VSENSSDPFFAKLIVPAAEDEGGEGEDDGLEAQRRADDPGDGTGADGVDDFLCKSSKFRGHNTKLLTNWEGFGRFWGWQD